MGRDRGARSGTSSGPGGKARSGHFTGDTHLSLLSAKNAGQTGLNRITQAVFSTSACYAFAGQVISHHFYTQTCVENAGDLAVSSFSRPVPGTH